VTSRKAFRGRSNFVSDIYLKGMMYGATIRSPYPHARILSINTRDVPEQAYALTAQDIPGENLLCVGDECMPILAAGLCRYAGEPVVLVAAETQAAVVEAIRYVSIEYEELPAVLDILPANDRSLEVTGSRGSVDDGLAQSEQVVEGSYTTSIQDHLYNEPQGAVAEPAGDHTLAVHCASQWPFHVREVVSGSLGIKPSAVLVNVTDTGVDMDGKLWYPSLVAAHAALLANAAGRPVKLVYSNLEDFQYTSKRAPVRVTHLTGIGSDGKLAAGRVEIVYNAGAYPLFSGEMTDRLAATALGLYSCDHKRVSVRPVRSNLPPMNIMSGFGTSSTQFAAETHVSRIVEILDSDPIGWRLANLDLDSYRSLDESIVADVLERVATASDFNRKHAAFSLQRKRRSDDERTTTRGIGLAIAAEGSGFIGQNEARYPSTIAVRLEKDSTAVLKTSSVPRLPSLRQHWRELVAQELGLEPGDVRIDAGRSDSVPDSGPSTLSRSVLVTERLIYQACATIQRRRFRSPLPIEVRRSQRLPKVISWDTGTLDGVPFSNSAFGVAVVEVSVDPISFETRVDDVWMAAYAGKILDEDGTRRSLEMGIYQALEWTTHEVVEFHDGSIDPRSYMSYRRVVRRNLPRIHIDLLPTAGPDPCGVGSLPFSCVPSALATAVSQATGRYMDRVPTNPELIHGYMEKE